MFKFIFLLVLLFTIGASATTIPAQFYQVFPDLRLCASPVCGGYFVQVLTPVFPDGIISEPVTLYVTGFNFTESPNITDPTPITSASPSDLVLYGFIGPQTGSFNLSQFFVISAYRALPSSLLFPRSNKRTHNHGSGNASGKAHRQKHGKHSKSFPSSSLSPSSSPIENYYQLSECANSNCYNSGVLTSQQVAPFTNVTFLDLAIFVDSVWVLHTSVSGSISLGYPANSNSNLIVRKTFVQLPQPTCQTPELPSCGVGFLPAFRRDDNRCLSTVGCVQRPSCPILFLPACAHGYTPVSFPSLDNGGCLQHYCDPSFLPLYYPPSSR